MRDSIQTANRVVCAAIGLFLFSLTACTSAQLTHFDNRTFQPVLEAELPETAWLAVDSCATGIHALVEIELASVEGIRNPAGVLQPARELRPSRPLPLVLEYGNGRAAKVRFSRLEGPICLNLSQWQDDRLIGSGVEPTISCSYRYTAQFDLPLIPKKDQSFRLHYYGQSVLLAQR